MTDPRDTRPAPNPDHPVADMDSLAREIDELARQRERIFKALRPEAQSSRNHFDERIEALESENKQLKERLAVLSAANPDALAEKLRKAEKQLDERTHEIQQLRLQGASDAALLEEMKKQNAEIERLKARLADADREKPDVSVLTDELRRLKINLADSIIEQKQVGATNQDLLKQIFELKQEVFQHQTQVRDLTLRLDLSKRSEQTLSDREKELGVELVRLRTLSEEAVARAEKLQQQLNEIATEHGKSREDLELSHAKIGELQAAYGRLKAEYEAERIQRQAAEAREHEIVGSFDTINQERLLLKEKVSRLLVGVKDYITPPSRPAATEDGVLEPREIQPYIPFCFPDSLPAQLRPHWKRTRQLPLVPPPGALTFAATPELQRPVRKPLLQPYRLRDMRCTPPTTMLTEPYPQPLPREFSLETVPAGLKMPTAFADRSFPEEAMLSLIERRFPPRILLPEMPERLPIARIAPKLSTHSLKLFLDFLERDILDSFHNGMYRLEYRYPPYSREWPEYFTHETQTISSGRVALHTTSHLQFALRYPVRTELSPRFPGERLKYLLRTIGDSLSSMMARLDNKDPDDDPGT